MYERCGKASPVSIVSGSASAAASETAPRSPAQPSSAGCCQGGYGSRSRMRFHIRRGR